MQELKIYRCEFCQTKYDDKTKCQECERGHKKPIDVKPSEYLPIFQDAKGYPYYVDVKMDNGKTVRYGMGMEVCDV